MLVAITNNIEQTHSHFPLQHPLQNCRSSDAAFWGAPGPKAYPYQTGKCHTVRRMGGIWGQQKGMGVWYQQAKPGQRGVAETGT